MRKEDSVHQLITIIDRSELLRDVSIEPRLGTRHPPIESSEMKKQVAKIKRRGMVDFFKL
jgi:hypothetical protein